MKTTLNNHPQDIIGHKNDRDSLEALKVLNEKSRKQAFTIEALDWGLKINPLSLWAPPGIGPLSFLPSFQKLPEKVQRRYNQLFSLGVCEQFTWLEQDVLVRTLKIILKKRKVPRDLKKALHYFIDEEEKHSEMFWRVCEKAAPNWYSTRKFRFYNVNPLQSLVMNIILDHPDVFLVWIWMAIFFEERTVDLCKSYVTHHRKNPGIIDPTFVQLHEYHYLDEVRHYQIDQHLLNWYYDQATGWKRDLCGQMFFLVMKTYLSPKRTSWKILDELKREFPSTEETLFDEVKGEIPTLKDNREFHKTAFSRRGLPKTMQLFTQYPEMDKLWGLFLVEEKSGSLI